MVRPTKPREVEQFPEITYFKPAGVPIRKLKEVILSIEELEALRLKDAEGLNQEEGAERMKISRPTFQRILTKARLKVSEALTKGMAIRVEGGTYQMSQRRLTCRKCGQSIERGRRSRGQQECPRCT